MTREDAITILKQPDRIGCNLIKANDEESTKYNQESIEALGMAIKALEQQPCEDTISRQAAIDALCKQCTVDRPETCSTIQKGDRWCEEVYTLLKVPSAQPERKTGKWILKKELVPLPWDSDPLDWNNYDEKTHSEWKEYYHCSNCDWKSGEFKGGNFCSNCGSYNGGEQND